MFRLHRYVTVQSMFATLFFAVIMVIALVIVNASTSVDAQSEPNNLQTYFEGLVDDINAGILVNVTIEFSSGTDTQMILASSNQDDGGSRIIEIGSDYICFDENVGGGYATFCTPYSNIASISYIRLLG